MNVAVVAIGLIALAMLAIAVGRAADQQARDRAWRRIAIDRRRNAEVRQALLDTTPPCRKIDCPLRLMDRGSAQSVDLE